MAFNLAQATALKGKKITLQYLNDENEVQEQDGVLVEVAPAAIMFRRTNSKSGEIYPAEKIEDIIEQAQKPKKLVVKKIKEVGVNDVRQHLVERHGYPISSIEAMDPAGALEFHKGLDHADLGHNHAAVEAETAEAAA